MRGPHSLRWIPSEDPADKVEKLGLLFSWRDNSDKILERLVGDGEVVKNPVAYRASGQIGLGMPCFLD